METPPNTLPFYNRPVDSPDMNAKPKHRQGSAESPEDILAHTYDNSSLYSSYDSSTLHKSTAPPLGSSYGAGRPEQESLLRASSPVLNLRTPSLALPNQVGTEWGSHVQGAPSQSCLRDKTRLLPPLILLGVAGSQVACTVLLHQVMDKKVGRYNKPFLLAYINSSLLALCPLATWAAWKWLYVKICCKRPPKATPSRRASNANTQRVGKHSSVPSDDHVVSGKTGSPSPWRRLLSRCLLLALTLMTELVLFYKTFFTVPARVSLLLAQSSLIWAFALSLYFLPAIFPRSIRLHQIGACVISLVGAVMTGVEDTASQDSFQGEYVAFALVAAMLWACYETGFVKTVGNSSLTAVLFFLGILGSMCLILGWIGIVILDVYGLEKFELPDAEAVPDIVLGSFFTILMLVLINFGLSISSTLYIRVGTNLTIPGYALYQRLSTNNGETKPISIAADTVGACCIILGILWMNYVRLNSVTGSKLTSSAPSYPSEPQDTPSFLRKKVSAARKVSRAKAHDKSFAGANSINESGTFSGRNFTSSFVYGDGGPESFVQYYSGGSARESGHFMSSSMGKGRSGDNMYNRPTPLGGTPLGGSASLKSPSGGEGTPTLNQRALRMLENNLSPRKNRKRNAEGQISNVGSFDTDYLLAYSEAGSFMEEAYNN